MCANVCYNYSMEEMNMKRYIVEMDDDLSCIYEDIAKMNKKNVEECLAIILKRVILTMIRQDESDKNKPS